MDKKNPGVRKYLAQRAELLGAVRLPNTAFKENAGTEVTSDILFLKKRDRVMDIEPDWVHLGENADGITMNQYFIDHPEMIAGKMNWYPVPMEWSRPADLWRESRSPNSYKKLWGRLTEGSKPPVWMNWKMIQT